jgi:hypothetical protein
MTINLNKVQRAGLGPITENITTVAGTTGTTPLKIADSDGYQDSDAIRRIRILNGSSSNRLAYYVDDVGEDTPTFSADFDANAGVIIQPDNIEFVNLVASKSIWIVASAASTEYCVSIIDE